jgi:hypothetical protein
MAYVYYSPPAPAWGIRLISEPLGAKRWPLPWQSQLQCGSPERADDLARLAASNPNWDGRASEAYPPKLQLGVGGQF